jgi:hypothetical protein
VLVVILLLAGIAWSAYLLKQMLELVRETSVPEITLSKQVDQEIERLSGVVESFESAVMARAGSAQLSVLAANISRRPFVPSPPPTKAFDEEAAAAAAMKEPVEPPPFVMVRAVLVKGKDAVAVLDVEGIGQGIVVKKGGTFAGGKGRVTGITAEKVVFTWAGQSVETAVGM